MKAIEPQMYRERYSTERIFGDNPVWQEISAASGTKYAWNASSTYIQKPPYFDGFELKAAKAEPLTGMRALALFGDSVTTDHISPAGAFKENTEAGRYLINLGVKESHFNSYGSRRGNHNVMMRGTFANVRIRNHLAEGTEGGYTKLLPEGTVLPIFQAAQKYKENNTPLIIFAGDDYGMGSSRDWAAKGSSLLGVRAVIAKSFERIHRSNLIGMGVLPLVFRPGESYETLGITGNETFNLVGIGGGLSPRQELVLEIDRGGKVDRVKVLARLDTPVEVDYYLHGGIMPYVLRKLIAEK